MTAFGIILGSFKLLTSGPSSLSLFSESCRLSLLRLQRELRFDICIVFCLYWDLEWKISSESLFLRFSSAWFFLSPLIGWGILKTFLVSSDYLSEIYELTLGWTIAGKLVDSVTFDEDIVEWLLLASLKPTLEFLAFGRFISRFISVESLAIF